MPASPTSGRRGGPCRNRCPRRGRRSSPPAACARDSGRRPGPPRRSSAGTAASTGTACSSARSCSVPLPAKSCGTFCWFRYGLGRERLLGADLVEHQEDLVLLDEAPGLLDGLRRVVGVVEVAVVDLPAVHAAVVVHVLEVGRRAVGNDRVGGLRPAERDGAADQDRARRDARVAVRRGAGDAGERERDEGERRRASRDRLLEEGELGVGRTDRSSSASRSSGRSR